MREVEIAIIGAGTAGMAAYRAAREHTDRLALIEGGPYGTTCARVGCMPSKLLIAAAERAAAVRETSLFGIGAGGPRIDGPAVMRRVRAERDRFVGFVLEAVEGFDAAHRLRGHARFLEPHVLDVGGERLAAERVVIATGSRPVRPKPFETAGDRLIVNDDVFDWTDLPGSVAVFGAGVIGVELGQALARLGVRVRLFGKDGDVAALSDPDVKAAALAALRRDLPVDPDAETREIAREDDGVRIRFVADGAEHEERFDWLLATTGRAPDLDGLDLDKAGLALEGPGVPHADPLTMQVGDSHIFLAGDASGGPAVLHEAADAGRIAGENAARHPDTLAYRRRVPLGIVFTAPNIATVGRTRGELDRAGCAYAVGEVDFAGQGRARVIGENAGLLRVYAERGTGLFLGAEMVAPRGEHLAHLLAWALQARLDVPGMLEMPFYHPVIEEGLRTALRDLRANLRLGRPGPPGCIDCGPGG